MKKDTSELLVKLRSLMHKPPEHVEAVSAYIVPSEDAHQSEYICQSDRRRQYVTGFDGSAGTAVVTNDKALLWTDGRYYQQATDQMDKNWILMKDHQPSTPSIGKWLAQNLSKGSKIGVDPRLLSFNTWTTIENDLKINDCKLTSVDQNLIDLIWEQRPQKKTNEIITLDISIVGKSIKEKFLEIVKEMNERNAQALVVSALDEIAWFLNARGSDIEYNPVFFSYLIITTKYINLFIDSHKLPKHFNDHLQKNNVEITVSPYENISNSLKEIVDTTDGKIWISHDSSYYLASFVPKNRRYTEPTPIALMKAVKNSTEAEGMINCHIRDGIALCKYFSWLENAVKQEQYVDEISGAKKLEEFRSKLDRYMGLSFETINASGPNGSIIHYAPKQETCRSINKNEMYLCDSGAQYLDGTTDVTRTFHFGEPTEFQKECYTRVLKGQLTLASTIFPRKIKGQVLDTLARKSLWDIGLNYDHGTGHGIGHFLNVHEGPMSIGIKIVYDDPGLQENMFVSNEPGYYEKGQFGIRIEDIVQIVSASAPHDFNGRGALTFKTITLCPKQTKLIKKELLTEKEINQLNEYHLEVRNTLLPILEGEGDSLTCDWLKRETEPI